MASEELLVSWNDTPTRQAIIDYVNAISNEAGEDFVPADVRVAVFDDDGTLWSERPLPVQLDFGVRWLAEKAAADPDLRDQQPYKAAYEGDQQWMGDAIAKHYKGDDADLRLLVQAVAAAVDGVSVVEYDARVREYFDSAEHPTLNRPYRTIGFVPMIELMRYLEANGFTNFIASGGDRDFMRPVVSQLYPLPPERVIGSALGMSYEETDTGLMLRYGGAVTVLDEGPEKPVRIWSRIGRHPLIAIGNADGDIPMLQFADATQAKPGLRLFVLHDDAEREFDDMTGAERLIALAQTKEWHAISMQHDWNRVFAD